jgi:hypothetical protein
LRCQTAKLPNIRLLDLRHSCATLLLAQGVNPRVRVAAAGRGAAASGVKARPAGVFLERGLPRPQGSSELARETDYDNFKSEVARYQGPDGVAYERALHDVWSVMYQLQE